jgi:hypothetical protein
MSEQAKEKETITFDRMPGSDAADAAEKAEELDMNFAFGEESDDVPRETEESEAEVEELEEPEVEEQPEPEESETEDEVEEQVAEEPEPDKKEAPKMIPKSRLDEVLAQNKALKKRIEQSEKVQKEIEEAPEAYDFDSREEEYMDAVLDGDKDKAKAIRKEIRQAEASKMESELTRDIEQKVTRSSTETAIQDAAHAIEEAFPIFDSNSDDFNEALTAEVNKYMTGFVQSGQNPVEALEEATTYVLQKNNMLDASTESVPTLGNTDPTAKKKAQVSKKLKAAESQPPDLPGESSANKGEQPYDLNNMTEEEFDALPEATLKRIRGDIL